MLQRDVAAIMNLDRTAYVKWENDINSPNVMQLIQLAKIFHCTVDELLDKDDEEGEEGTA